MKKKPVRIPIRFGNNAQMDTDAVPPTESAPSGKACAHEQATAESVTTEETTKPGADSNGAIDWRDQALRLQAEMENYRKRQQKLADDRVAQTQTTLLLKFLGIVDNLKRILDHLQPDNVHDQSIRLTYEEMLRILRTEGVEPIKPIGSPFDPEWHEAVAMVPASSDQQAEMIVIEEEQQGYQLAGRLLRPARVIVAKK